MFVTHTKFSSHLLPVVTPIQKMVLKALVIQAVYTPISGEVTATTLYPHEDVFCLDAGATLR